MRIILIFTILFLIFNGAKAQETSIDILFRSSYRVWELQRNDIGIYRDSKLFNGGDYHPSSVANIGIGLISLCIADSMGWEESASEKALLTLKSVTGHTQGFVPDRNSSGFFRHFIDMQTGVQHWDSEYSTIDTEILVSGALFAKNYFKNDSISKYALELWNSIDHEKAIADAENGKIYLSMQANGDGTPNFFTSVYNEYMIVAWMAKNASTNANSPANIIWEKYYANPDILPQSVYNGNNVLTDQPGHFMSSFTHLFNYYLCHYFTTSEKYIDYLKLARQADYDWWQLTTGAQEWEWGCGAGTGPEGYQADKINNNQNQVISPQIIAGFLPVFPEGENHLRQMWINQKGRYVFPYNQGEVLLWRYSLQKPEWIATEIQGIDYSTMLFGLASLPQFLGNEFFERNNNFFGEPLPNASDLILKDKNEIRLLTNPIYDFLIFELLGFSEKSVEVEIITIQSEVIFSKKIENLNAGIKVQLPVSELVAGVYFLKILSDGKLSDTKKFVKY